MHAHGGGGPRRGHRHGRTLGTIPGRATARRTRSGRCSPSRAPRPPTSSRRSAPDAAAASTSSSVASTLPSANSSGLWRNCHQWAATALPEPGGGPRRAAGAAGTAAEAEALLSGFEDDPDCVASAAALDRALGRPALAGHRLRGALGQLRRHPVLTLPLMVRLVDAALDLGDVELAVSSAHRIGELAAVTGTTLHGRSATRPSGRSTSRRAGARPSDS